MDPEEDSSVTAAVINVVCELGWRRPHDFLPLAPRLFDLLVNSGNNWMAIKIIKLVCLRTVNSMMNMKRSDDKLTRGQVRNPYAVRAAASEEATTTPDQFNTNDQCHVTSI